MEGDLFITYKSDADLSALNLEKSTQWLNPRGYITNRTVLLISDAIKSHGLDTASNTISFSKSTPHVKPNKYIGIQINKYISSSITITKKNCHKRDSSIS